jgi:hypothetical protein
LRVSPLAGILIALSLEGVRESFHNASLVHEARENIRREIADNRREVDNEIAGGALAHMDYSEVQHYASVYMTQDFLVQQHRTALDAASAALGILSAGEGDPTAAPPAEIDHFRQQVITLRSIVFVEEQMSHRMSEVYTKALQ